MYVTENIELMRRNFHKIFDEMIEATAHDENVSFVEFAMKIRNIEALREEIDFSFDSILCYIYRQIKHSDDPDQSIF
jgi:hypothetical protein